MGDSRPSQTGEAPKPAKKSFFKKASWQKAEDKPGLKSNDATEFFSKRSHFQEIIAEQESRRKERQEKKRHDTGKRKSDEKCAIEARDGKKLRVSEEPEEWENDADIVAEDNVKSKENSPRKPRYVTPSRHERATRRNVVARRTKEREMPKPAPTVIDISDSDSDATPVQSNSRLRKSTGKSKSRVADEFDDDDDLEDPYLRKLAEEARERQRRRELEAAKSASPPSKKHTPTSLSHATSNPQSEEPETTVKVFISSPIPETEPLIVTIFLTMRLGMVKEAWCKQQGLTDELTSSVFLTHNNKRLYDVTTVKALGVTADNVDELGNVHVVAVTPELFEDMKKQTAKSKPAVGGAQEPADEEEEGDEKGSKEKAKTIKIVLKGKGLEDFKLEVKPETTFQKIANAFRSSYKISKEQHLVLMFDGDPLDPEMAMQDSEIEDMDVIEVHMN